MSDKGAQEEACESAEPKLLGDGKILAKVQRDLDEMLAHCPADPIERLFWHEHWLRVAAKRFATNENQENRCLLRQMAILYSAVTASLGARP